MPLATASLHPQRAIPFEKREEACDTPAPWSHPEPLIIFLSSSSFSHIALLIANNGF